MDLGRHFEFDSTLRYVDDVILRGAAIPMFARAVAIADAAIGIAGRIPGARKGTVEIRPVISIHGLPGERPGSALADVAGARS